MSTKPPKGQLVLESAQAYLGAGKLGNLSQTNHCPPAWPLSIVPNFSDWQEGDIVLMESHGVKGRVLSLGQTLLPSAGASAWIHCGIYTGQGQVIDAMPLHGIREHTLATLVQRRSIRVRRLEVSPGTTVDRTIGLKIAKAARDMLGAGYNYRQLAADVARAMAGMAGGSQVPSKLQRPHYCSSLVVDACALGARVHLGGLYPPPMLPAVLAQHAWLGDVPLYWANNPRVKP